MYIIMYFIGVQDSRYKPFEPAGFWSEGQGICHFANNYPLVNVYITMEHHHF